MAVDGTWKIKVATPMGEQDATLTLKAAGAVLTGTQSGAAGSMQIRDGKIDGNKLSWSGEITQPFPMKLDFSLTMTGDELKGEVKAGTFGNMPVTGKRIS